MDQCSQGEGARHADETGGNMEWSHSVFEYVVLKNWQISIFLLKPKTKR